MGITHTENKYIIIYQGFKHYMWFISPYIDSPLAHN